MGTSASPFYNPATELAACVDAYQRTGDLGTLFDQLKDLAKRSAPEELKTAARQYQEMPEVMIPLYERIVTNSPNDAQAMVVLANAYWLTGRGPDAVSELASRAKSVDPSNRGAWHMWALAEPNIRARGARRQRDESRQ